MTKPWVIVTGKGSAYIVDAPNANMATTRFQKRYPGDSVGQCFEATIVAWLPEQVTPGVAQCLD